MFEVIEGGKDANDPEALIKKLKKLLLEQKSSYWTHQVLELLSSTLHEFTAEDQLAKTQQVCVKILSEIEEILSNRE